ncbi:hypothetical protein Ciccas_007698, partial [Cichlidogyrus casuarinus]
ICSVNLQLVTSWPVTEAKLTRNEFIQNVVEVVKLDLARVWHPEIILSSAKSVQRLSRRLELRLDQHDLTQPPTLTPEQRRRIGPPIYVLTETISAEVYCANEHLIHQISVSQCPLAFKQDGFIPLQPEFKWLERDSCSYSTRSANNFAHVGVSSDQEVLSVVCLWCLPLGSVLSCMTQGFLFSLNLSLWLYHKQAQERGSASVEDYWSLINILFTFFCTMIAISAEYRARSLLKKRNTRRLLTGSGNTSGTHSTNTAGNGNACLCGTNPIMSCGDSCLMCHVPGTDSGSGLPYTTNGSSSPDPNTPIYPPNLNSLLGNKMFCFQDSYGDPYFRSGSSESGGMGLGNVTPRWRNSHTVQRNRMNQLAAYEQSVVEKKQETLHRDVVPPNFIVYVLRIAVPLLWLLVTSSFWIALLAKGRSPIQCQGVSPCQLAP